MTRLLLVSLMIAVPLFAVAEEPLPSVTIHAITQLIPRFQSRFDELRSGDLVVLDLDNTVFRESQLLGTDEWYDFAISQLTRRGLSRRDASEKLEPLNRAIKTTSRMKLMEDGFPKLISELQARGIFVVGLTARHPNLAAITLKHLHELKVNFGASHFPKIASSQVPGLTNAFLFSEGIAFTDGSPKGRVLRFLIEETGIRPQKVIAADDRIHHIHTIVENLLDMGLSGHVVHYLRVREEPLFDEDLARIQQEFFEKSGVLMSDDEARSRLSCQERLTGLTGLTGS